MKARARHKAQGMAMEVGVKIRGQVWWVRVRRTGVGRCLSFFLRPS